MCICSNAFFTGGYAPRYPPSLQHIFITHFLICHSFLDFLYMPLFPPSGK